MISVVVPAHNERAVIGRLLTALLSDARPDEFEVVVVANGCTDGTEAVAASFGDPVRVVSTPVAGKYPALRLGDAHTTSFPRLYVDADVVLGTNDARALAEALNQPGVLAVAPHRVLVLDGRPVLVRWYYDVWQQLPAVRTGLFGRGVIGVSAEGHALLAAVPDVMGDDLAASLAFGHAQRRVVPGARVLVHPPRSLGDLVRRRIRSLTCTAQLQARLPEAVAEARTSLSDLLRLPVRSPLIAPKLALFLAVTTVARTRARRPIRAGDFTTWLRDESSRTG